MNKLSFRAKTFSAFVLIAAMMMNILTGAWAAESGTGSNVEIRFQVGGDSLWINGKVVKTQKSFIQNKLAFVPLNPIASAFGATLKSDPKTQTTTISNGSHRIAFKTGSINATADGKQIKLDAAPRVMNKTTMVTLKFITVSFGTTSSWNGKTKQYTIKGKKAVVPAPPKKMIGDSELKWSMNEPDELSLNDMNDDGTHVVFTDKKENYILEIVMNEAPSATMKSEDLLSDLYEFVAGVEETVVEKKVVTVGGTFYAKIVSKDEDGSYEYRSYCANGFIYYVVLSAFDVKDYKSKAQKYNGLLNSFRTSYDKNNKNLKDLSLLRQGSSGGTSGTPSAGDPMKMNEVKYDLQGFSVSIPENWKPGALNKAIGAHYNIGKLSNFVFYPDPDTSYEQAIKDEDDLYVEDPKFPDYKLVEKKTETISGASATKYVTHNVDDFGGYQSTVYILSQNNVTYYFEIELYDSEKTEIVEQQINAVLQSVKFIK